MQALKEFLQKYDGSLEGEMKQFDNFLYDYFEQQPYIREEFKKRNILIFI